MGQLIIEKSNKEFATRVITTNIIIAGIVAFGSVFVGLVFTLITTVALIVGLVTEWHKERKTITKLEVENDGFLRIELTDFDKLKQFVIKFEDLEVTLKRSYRRLASRLSIDFWVKEDGIKRKILRQHCNTSWNSQDVKEIFLKIKKFKDTKLTVRERNILNDYEFS